MQTVPATEQAPAPLTARQRRQQEQRARQALRYQRLRLLEQAARRQANREQARYAQLCAAIDATGADESQILTWYGWAYKMSYLLGARKLAALPKPWHQPRVPSVRTPRGKVRA